jgi:hypothetical protein
MKTGAKRSHRYLFIVASANHNITVFAGEYLVRNDRGMCCAVSIGFLPCDEIVGCNIRKARDLIPRVTRLRILRVQSDTPVTRIDYSRSRHPSLSSGGK